MSLPLAMLVLGALVLTQAFFSGAEIAMVSADRLRLSALSERGHSGAALALSLLEQEHRLVGTCLIGTNLSIVSSSTVATSLLVGVFHLPPWSTPFLFAPLVLILGEALPKTVFQHHGTVLAPILSFPLYGASILMTPFLWVISGWSTALQWLVGEDAAPTMTREELVELLDPETRTEIDPADREVIRGLLSLAETRVEACMTPLIAVHAIDATSSVNAAMEMVARTRHSRLPVFQSRIDHVVGVVHQNDLLFLPQDRHLDQVGSHARSVRFVPENMRADDLFRAMRESADPFAIVVDEYGGCIGLVTIEDLLEELVGDIEDERERRSPSIRRHENSWLVPAQTELEDLERVLQTDLPDGDYETVAGLVLELAGRIPAAREVFDLEGWQITVEDADERAIRMVSVQRVSQPDQGKPTDAPTH